MLGRMTVECNIDYFSEADPIFAIQPSDNGLGHSKLISCFPSTPSPFLHAGGRGGNSIS